MTPEGPRPQGRWVGNTLAEFERDLADNLCYQRGTTAESASAQDAYWTLAVTVRDRLADRRARTARANHEANPKFVYYLSAEYMLGRQFRQNALYTGTAGLARQAMAGSGYSAGELEELDVEPGLGNGGLGRLAACLLDSLATLDMPAVGYGIRYEFGIFKQAFQDGHQIELPDDWTFYGNPWEFPAPDDLQVVGFYGHTEPVDDDQGGLRARWLPAEMVRGEPSHMLVPGYGTQTVNILRLWRARAGHESFDLGLFNAGRYAEAVEAQMRSENLTKVLYPSDSTEAGRELRLKQQYFLVCCSLRDIIRRFRFRNSDWEAFPDKVVIQLNDTHPVLAIPELMRLLVDEHGIDWEQAWSITRRTFAYTCHTLLPEALETWPVPLFGRLLPRHLEIIYALNHSFLEDVRARYPGDEGRVARMSLIQEDPERRVRMANLAVVGGFAVNGVAELQSRLLAATTLRDFADLWPEKFLNVTNGVSPRRFVRLANPRLSALITARLGDDRWLTDLDRLAELEAFAGDEQFRAQWREAKRQNKIDLAFHVLAATGVIIDPASLFDVMVKRLHEYKRQILKLLHVVTVYNRIKADPAAAVTPCTVIFGAKAAPGYQRGQAHHQADQLGRRRGQRRPRRGRPDQGRVPARLQRLGQRARGGRRQPLGADLAGRQGGLRHRQHETGPQRGPHRRHARRRQHRDPRPGRDRQLLPVRPHRRPGHRAQARRVLPPRLVRRRRRAQGRHRRPHLRCLLRRQTATPSSKSSPRSSTGTSTWSWPTTGPTSTATTGPSGPPGPTRTGGTRMSILNAARSGFFSSDRTVRDYNRDIWHTEPVPVPPYPAADLNLPARVPDR